MDHKSEIKKRLKAQLQEMKSYYSLSKSEIEQWAFGDEDIVELYFEEKGISLDDINLEDYRDLQFLMISELEEFWEKDKSMRIGTPVSICHVSDRYAGHIVHVVSEKKIGVLQEGYSPDWTQYYSLRKDGKFRRVGDKIGEGPYLVIGKAETYLSPEI